MTSINNLIQRTRTYDVGTEDRARAGQSTARPQASSSASVEKGGDDSITLTKTGSQMAATAREMAATPAFDAAKVERIKSLIAEGQYSVDPQRLADRFIELEAALGRA